MGKFLTANLALAAALLSTATAWANFPSMAAMVPPDTNAVVAIDVERILASEVAKQNNWGKAWTNSWEYGAITVPPGTKRVLGALRVLRSLAEAKWRVSMMELTSMIPPTDIARAEAGYVDKMWDKTGVISPAGTIFVQMSPELLTSWTPADRQGVVKWLQKPQAGGPASDFLRGTVNAASSAPISMGIELADMYSAADVRRALDMQVIAIDDPKADLNTISEIIASIQNVSMKIAVKDKLDGQIQIEFGMPAALMEFYAKPALMGLLNRSDISIPEIADWKVTTKEKTVTIAGELKPESLKPILAMVTMPAPNIIDVKNTTPSDDPKVIGQVSQTYYRAFSAVIDQAKPAGKGMGENAQALNREAQRLARLPLVNVDPDLAAWGTNVSTQLQGIAMNLRADQQDAKSKMTGVMNPGGNYGSGYGYTGGYSYDGTYDNGYWQNNSVARQNAQRQRSQALTETRAAAIRDAEGVLSKIIAERNDLRAKLTQKYGIDF